MFKLFNRAKLSAAERNLRSRIAQLASGQGLLRGNLSERSSKCGKPSCHCVTGEWHPSVCTWCRVMPASCASFAYPKRGASESVRPLRTTRKCNASLRRFPNWNGNASSRRSPDLLRRLIAYADQVFHPYALLIG